MKEKLEDLEDLMKVKNFPILRKDTKDGTIKVINKENCKDLKELDQKVKELQNEQIKLSKIVKKLEVDLRRNINLSKFINDKITSGYGNKIK